MGNKLEFGLSNMKSISIDGKERYFYCGGQTISIHDVTTQKKLQKLSGLGNAITCTSAEGSYLGCIHPLEDGNTTEIRIYDINNNHQEMYRTYLNEHCVSKRPCFTLDGKQLVFAGGSPSRKLFSISTKNGELKCIYECHDNESIQSITVGNKGIVLVVHGEKAEVYLEYISVINPVTKVRVELSFRFTASTQLQKIYACWINDNRIMITYHLGRFKSGITTVDISQLLSRSSYDVWTQELFPFVILPNPKFSWNHQFVAFHTYCPSNQPFAIAVYRTDNWKQVFKHTGSRIQDSIFIKSQNSLLINSDDVFCIKCDDFSV